MAVEPGSSPPSADPAIGLLGDVMLGRMVGDALARGAPESVWAPELRELAASLDLVVANLECCISTRGDPTTLIEGKPFFFRAPPVAVEALRALNIGVVSLANNHALDFGADALSDTVELLADAGVATVGAGLGVQAARQPAVVSAGGRRIAVVAATDHPVEYAAGPDRPGVAHAESSPEWVLEAIADARREVDLVIAFPHWGPNMTTRPSERQHVFADAMLDAGADLVAGHSAHVFHGVGWRGRPVLFDLGDALDDYRVEPQLRNDLGLLAIWRPAAGGAELELVGLKLDYCHTRLTDGDDADWTEQRLTSACAELGARVRRVDEWRFVVESQR